MSRNFVYTGVLLALIVIFGIAYYGEQKRSRRILAENERLLNETRDLKRSLALANNTSQQIADRSDIQQRVQGTFVERRAYYRRNWKQFISVTTSDYKTGFLGGIKDLKIIVKNLTEYSLDNAVVNVQYLRSNGDVFKTEEYTVNNIPPKSSQTVNAAGSRRGMKVQLKLRALTSQAMNFCWAYDKAAAPGNPDPYQCVAQ